MCNAELETKDSSFLKASEFQKHLDALRPYAPATCTLSGGEPTLVPELPEIIDRAVRYFPFGVAINSNFYSLNKRFPDNITAALKAGIRISCSFDAFGDLANRQRGAKDVEAKTIENMKFVAEKKKELNSKSKLIVHTVISDITISHVEKVFELAEKFGYEQRIAPAVQFYYQKPHPDAPGLQASEQLRTILKRALALPGGAQNRYFVKGIMAHALGKAPKLCPYITWPFQASKVFLDPNGDISLCDRHPIGNIHQTTFEKMLATPLYAQKQLDHENCHGCWMGCFVEPVLTVKPWNKNKIDALFEANIPEKTEQLPVAMSAT
jgi:sulfatase maturation enzyme AslB (radical SAM superfamily)